MQQLKVEGRASTRERGFGILLWGTLLFLMAVIIMLVVLRASGRLSAGSNLRFLFVFASVAAVIGGLILACLEALHYAKRQMVFVLDDTEIVRKRRGYPDRMIAFSEIQTLREEFGWLIVNSTEPQMKIAVPTNITGYAMIRSELARHHAVSVPAKFPLKSAALLPTSIVCWAAVLWVRDLRVLIPAAVVGLALLVFGSYKLWLLVRRSRNRLLVLVCLSTAWIAAAFVIYACAVRP